MMRPLADELGSARRQLLALRDDMKAHLSECLTCAPDQFVFCSAAGELLEEIAAEQAFVSASEAQAKREVRS